jgi:L-ascorbate metabolism protein UlaG (beta-lactamase superfamily)
MNSGYDLDGVVTVAFMPMNIPVERMMPAAAAACVRIIKPKVVYLYHYNQDYAARAANPNARQQGLPGGITIEQSLQALEALQGEPIEFRRGAWYP